jgi:SAM-dependent methyltransferase
MSDLDRVRRDWERWGQQDPLFAVYTKPGTESGGWDVTEFLASGQETVDDLVGQLTAAGVELPVGSALDFGCGVGRLTSALTRHFDDVHGVDISEPMVAEARELATRLDRQPTYHVNHQPNLRLFADGRFAFVLSIVVLQHMPQEIALGYVREFLRVLRPGGIAVFQIPEAHGAPERLLDERRLSPATRNRLVRVRARVLRKPTMEMHPIPAAAVLGAVERAGGRVRTVAPDGFAGRLYHSLTYAVEKLPEPEPSQP